jgi:ABC-2 type transport system ATP-binding protein
MDNAIEIQHLTKRYGNVVALDDVSLTVGHGEIFGIVGPKGAGVSALIDRALLRL